MEGNKKQKDLSIYHCEDCEETRKTIGRRDILTLHDKWAIDSKAYTNECRTDEPEA